MAFTDELFAAAQASWDAQLRHPFVAGVGDGSLEEERFKRWVLQDYRYLEQFARVFAWAAAKSDTLEAMRWFVQAANLTLNTDMELHRQYAARFGLPVYAECGRLMYMSRAIVRGQRRAEMVGAVPARAVMHIRPQGRGYVRMRETGKGPWPIGGVTGGAEILGHELH